MLVFETSERIGTPEDGALAPEIEIHDNDSNKIGIGTVSVQSTDAGTERLWKAEFTIPDEEVFSNYEMDLGFKISVKDPSGNPRVIGFDELGTLIDETGTQTTQAPSNGARIDTKSPEVEFVSLKTSNQGLPDQDRLTHLLAKEGDELTLYFTSSERIAGVDETSTNTLLKPIVEFKAGTDIVFDATVSRDTLAMDSQNEESLHKGLHWKAVINIDPSTDTNFSDLESDLGFTVKILDPAGNEYSASDTASSMPKPEDDEGLEFTGRVVYEGSNVPAPNDESIVIEVFDGESIWSDGSIADDGSYSVEVPLSHAESLKSSPTRTIIDRIENSQINGCSRIESNHPM